VEEKRHYQRVMACPNEAIQKEIAVEIASTSRKSMKHTICFKKKPQHHKNVDHKETRPLSIKQRVISLQALLFGFLSLNIMERTLI